MNERDSRWFARSGAVLKMLGNIYDDLHIFGPSANALYWRLMYE